MAVISSLLSLSLANPLVTAPIILVFGVLLLINYLFGIYQPFGTQSPFKRADIRDPAPFEHNNAVRDKVLKRGFTTSKIPADLDAVVIGSGISGLSTAAVMAKCGKRVLVLEQHDQAGGCCHTFREKSFEFDVGIHYVGDMCYGTELRVLTDLITDGQLRWEPLSSTFDEVIVDKEHFPIKKGHDNLRDTLLSRFPEEKLAIDIYMSALQDLKVCGWPYAILKFLPARLSRFLMKSGIIGRLSNLFTYTPISLEEFLDNLTDNEMLKTVLSYIFGDAGVLPKDVSFFTYASILNHFVNNGAYYPYGGSSEVAYHTLPVIRQAGGDVLVRAKVVKILDDGKGRVVGVRVQKSVGSECVDVFAKAVVSSAGLLKTKEFIPSYISDKSQYFQTISRLNLVPGAAGISVFVGLNGSTEELNLPKFNNWIMKGTKISQRMDDYLALSREEAKTAEVPLLFMGFPSAKDPTWRVKNPGKSAATLITFTNYDWFKDWEETRYAKRGQDYESFKTALGRMMWKKCIEHYPQLEDKVEYFDVGSPLTNNHYLASTSGEFYGLDHSMSRNHSDAVIDLRPETDIPGLFITGQDIFSGGYAGALFSGVLTSSALLGRNILVDILLFKLTRYVKEQYLGRFVKAPAQRQGVL